MDPRHSVEMSKHLEKQNHTLIGTYRAMSHGLHKLQVEEEAITCKLYELMSAEGLLPKSSKKGMLLRGNVVKPNSRRKTKARSVEN